MNHQAVRIWLWVGVVMVFVQVILGGITRLTGSGLSITQWDIVTGTIPPLNAEEWESEFNLYKQTPQYHQINQGMEMGQFKFIYFWEYFHRVWARLIGFVFAIPFVVFLIRGWLDRRLLRDLVIAVLLGAVVAVFGWIMVASGLVERPWVNAYKLTIHLNLALILYAWLFWVALGREESRLEGGSLKRVLNFGTVLIAIQLILGGLMSGMKAGVYYPTWPDMHGAFLPAALLNADIWTSHYVFEAYEQGPMPGIVQFLHRITAYLIAIVSVIIVWKSGKYSVIQPHIQKMTWVFAAVILVQVVVGIFTVINCIGRIPLLPGVLHQAMAIVVLSVLIYLHRKIKA